MSTSTATLSRAYGMRTTSASGVRDGVNGDGATAKKHDSLPNAAAIRPRSNRCTWMRNERCPFKDPTNTKNPGPGSYASVDDFMHFVGGGVRVPTSLRVRVGFDSTDDRFGESKSMKRGIKMPGPGSYVVDHHTIDREARLKPNAAQYATFGVRDQRFKFGVFPREKFVDHYRHPVPGPGMYSQENTVLRGASNIMREKKSSVFESNTKRFDQARRARAKTFGTPVYVPGMRAMSREPEEVSSRGYVSKTSTRLEPFASQSGRYDHMSQGQVFVGASKDRGTYPGPGAYNLRTQLRERQRRNRANPTSVFGTSQKRWAVNSGDASGRVPGPATYAPAGTSVVKRTFNVSLRKAKR
eukprot:g4141.t1